METFIRTIMNLIASEVCSKQFNRSQYYSLTTSDDELVKLFRFSKAHDLAHLVGYALIKNDLIKNDEIKAKFQNQMLLAFYRYEKINFELGRLRRTLDEAQVPFVPLKGAVLQQYYPEPWMRTSCDIDVLVHEEDLQRAVFYLTDNHGYSYTSQSSHDVSIFSQNGNHIELHYDILGDNTIDSSETVLKKIWDVAVRSDNGKYQHELPDEMFYFYHIAHMAKHFVSTGGCGIRPFLDIWVLNHCVDFDREKRDKLLSDGGLNVFAKRAELLSEVWFGNAEHTEIIHFARRYVWNKCKQNCCTATKEGRQSEIRAFKNFYSI